MGDTVRFSCISESSQKGVDTANHVWPSPTIAFPSSFSDEPPKVVASVLVLPIRAFDEVTAFNRGYRHIGREWKAADSDHIFGRNAIKFPCVAVTGVWKFTTKKSEKTRAEPAASTVCDVLFVWAFSPSATVLMWCEMFLSIVRVMFFVRLSSCTCRPHEPTMEELSGWTPDV